MAYQPIENHGIIGDMHTVALVCSNGTIDWLCFPHFDSPSVFAAILDDKKGGHFSLTTADDDATEKQFYWPDTNVLVTRFLSANGVGEIIDYMPIHNPRREHGRHQIIRRVATTRGDMKYRVECFPAFNYARDSHEVDVGSQGACFRSSRLNLGLATQVPLSQQEKGVVAEFTLEQGKSMTFILHELQEGQQCGANISESESEEHFERTVHYWRRWLRQCTYHGRWQEMVRRSALALKLMTHQPTGAMVASPTTSLPETIGGERNWDYRYTWIRDAAFTLYGLLRIGFTEEAVHFMEWIEGRIKELGSDGSLPIMYTIHGEHKLTEHVLDHLEGYRGSAPVRIGNDAHNQLQLDIYGELLDSVYLYNKYSSPISYDMWRHVRDMINWLIDNWHRKDEGIWEVRGGRRHFVYSKLMTWVALDRALRLANKRSFPADRDKWLRVRDEIYEEIMDKGWHKERRSFVQAYDNDTLDAANLIMPLVFFVSPTDPRMLSTLDETLKSPKHGGLVADSLVYRYNVEKSPDGLAGAEGTFNICTFWLVEALTRAGDVYPERLEQARLMFEKMLGYSNHLGLYAEETGPKGEALGNFPQAFTHLSLISAAYNLDRRLGGRR